MLKPFLAASVLLAGSFSALAQDADTVVATVNDEAITLGQMIAMRQGLGEEAVQNMPDTALWDLLLDQMIRQTAVAQMASDPLSKRDAAALEVERRAYLAGRVLEDVAAPEPTDEELRAIYDQIFGDQSAPAVEYNAAHILVETREEAEAIAGQLAEGADFGALAEEKSTDNSGPNKGDLGWFQADQMVAPFAEAVKALEKGQVSAPVESQFGWHVIKLNDSREVTPPSLDDIKPQLAVQLRRDRVQAEIEKRVTESKVEKTEGLGADLLNKTELLGE
ncbi:peptidyl-prolyl cis-trans isomerase C [Paracoccus halophilus]|uniref:Parvulin-like PPIase n=1 Tax=Paracoccus halophilus TaxID=376733 RepID=A0A099F1I3_9RHOB|nr:peptidylprolyl isomerase [Paracoccus halophilus]KGJ04329.1 peptidylprolyl isomerase [Paracoccus halophilus]SFA55332.1 peptidyl-prolyl cis-trans isomerase C [Paracoccus halophilus]